MSKLNTSHKGEPKGGRGPHPHPQPLPPVEPHYSTAAGPRHSGREVLDADAAPAGRLRAGASRPAIAVPLNAPPNWFEDMAHAAKDLEALVHGIFERTLKHPSPKTLAEAAALLNQLARDPKAAAVITPRLKAVSFADMIGHHPDGGVEDIETAAVVYTGPNETGRMRILLLGKNARYAFCSGGDLRGIGFYNQIQSGILYASKAVDVSLVAFFQGDFAGDFMQFTAPSNSAPQYFWSLPEVKSLMLVATPSDSSGTYLSFKNRFQADWDNTLDAFLRTIQGRRVYRNGEPVLSWDVTTEPYLRQYFYDPSTIDPDWRHKALKVHQDVTIDTESVFAGQYQAWMEYWIFLYVSGGNVRAVVPMWDHWVEPGHYHDQVDYQFDQQVGDGRLVLENHLNTLLAAFDGLTVREIFYLSGAQSGPPGADVFGTTRDDVTIVLL